MTDQPKLRPCPFCGSEELAGTTSYPFCILCRDCGATGPATHNAQEAAAAWNRRAGDEVIAEVCDAISSERFTPFVGVVMQSCIRDLRKLLEGEP